MEAALLGYGVVGKGVADLLEKHPEYGITLKYILIHSKRDDAAVSMVTDFSLIENDPEVSCVLECIGGDTDALDYAFRALNARKHLISVNKKMLARHYALLSETAKRNGVQLLYSASCGGGIPWIRNLAEIAQREEIRCITGIMNGTSNYILDRIDSAHLSFTDALSEAQQKGYAERDPSDDIDGVDTTNKLVLSANLAFHKIFDPIEVPTLGIRNFQDVDRSFAQKLERKCILAGMAVKDGEDVSLMTLPLFVKKDDRLAGIRKNYNCFTLTSENLSDLSFSGEGAGRYPTAANMIRDLLQIKEGTDFPYELYEQGKNAETYQMKYYIRSKDSKAFEEMIEEHIGENSYLSKQVKLSELREAWERNRDKEAFIAGIAYDQGC